jgi:alkylation response protein AidB-like acyl-CoA dehydrogenase
MEHNISAAPVSMPAIFGKEPREGGSRHVPEEIHRRRMAMSTQAASQQATEFPYFIEEHDLIRQTVTRFCKEDIAPFAAEWDEQGIFPRELFKKAGDLGLFGIRIDPRYGGSGQDWWATTAYVESMSNSDSGSVNMAFLVQSDMSLPVIQELGTDEQKEEFLPPAVRGDWIGALGKANPAADRMLQSSKPGPALKATI